nr:hypothetical protein [Bacillus cereus]
MSRKGFDEKSGGEASPIFNNKLISFPIPRADSGIFYKQMFFEKNYTYLKVMKDLGIRQYSEAHIDPDLIYSIIPNRHPKWKSAFGQSGIAQATLARAGIEKGDLFLFFGWFKKVDIIDNKFKYLEGRGPDKGFHAVYGYLEVGDVIDLTDSSVRIPEGIQDHPHVLNRLDYEGPNSIYIATEQLSFDNSKPGSGCFYFQDNLVLTQPGLRKSNWLLPTFFKEVRRDFNAKIIFGDIIESKVKITTKGKTQQEFFISSANQAVEWAKQVILQSEVY